MTNATIKRDLNALSQVFNYAIGQGYFEVNSVLPRMRTVREKRDPIVLPDPVHIARVIERCPPGLAKMVRAALVTGRGKVSLWPVFGRKLTMSASS